MIKMLFYTFFVSTLTILQVGCVKKKDTNNIITHKQ